MNEKATLKWNKANRPKKRSANKISNEIYSFFCLAWVCRRRHKNLEYKKEWKRDKKQQHIKYICIFFTFHKREEKSLSLKKFLNRNGWRKWPIYLFTTKDIHLSLSLVKVRLYQLIERKFLCLTHRWSIEAHKFISRGGSVRVKSKSPLAMVSFQFDIFVDKNEEKKGEWE